MAQPAHEMSVVVVSFNTREVLRACLKSVATTEPVETVVVDDGSTDGSLEMLERDFAAVVSVRTPNLGYGAAANAGIAATTSKYVLLLNSDTVLPPAALGSISAYLDVNPRAAVVGPRLLNPDRTLQRSIHQFPSTLVTLLDYSWLGKALGRIPLARKLYLASDAHDRPRVVDWLTGAALAFRRCAYDSVNGFDPSFLMYYEEVDLSYRLRQAGWETHFTPVVDVVHIGGASTSQNRHLMYVRQLKSGIQFFEQHYSRRSARRGRWAFRSAMRLNLVGEYLRAAFDIDRKAAAEARGRIAGWRAILGDLRTSSRQHD